MVFDTASLLSDPLAQEQGLEPVAGCPDPTLSVGATSSAVMAHFRGLAVAVKAYPSEIARGAELPHHPNVVRTLAWISVTDATLEVRELCVGGELFEAVAEIGQLTPALALRHLEELCAAVAHCHLNGQVFGRLRAEKLLLGFDGHLRLVPPSLNRRCMGRAPWEFDAPEHAVGGGGGSGGSSGGAATVVGAGVEAVAFGGSDTPPQSGPPLDATAARADVWSCAALFCLMLAGEPPEDAGVIRGVGERGIEAYPAVADVCPEEVHELLRAMLSPNPARRPSAWACATALSAAREVGYSPGRTESADAVTSNLTAPSRGCTGSEATASTENLADLDKVRGTASSDQISKMGPPEASSTDQAAKRQPAGSEPARDETARAQAEGRRLKGLGFVRSASDGSNKLV